MSNHAKEVSGEERKARNRRYRLTYRSKKAGRKKHNEYMRL
jgi:hypothetical protein